MPAIDDIYVEIRLRAEELKRDMRRIPYDAEKIAKNVEDSFRRHKIDMDNRLMKMKLKDVQKVHQVLKKQLEHKIKMNVDMASINKTRIGIQSVENALRGVEKQTDKVQSKFGKFKDLFRNMLGGFALLAIGRRVFADFREFDTAMRNVNTITRLSEKEFKSLRSEVRELSSELGVGAGGLADALYQTVSAGIKTKDAMTFLATAVRSARAGVTDTETAVDALTNIINAWGLTASDATEVADVMFRTVEIGRTTFRELASSISQVSSVAAASGISFRQILALTATLTKLGGTTSEAITRITSAIFGMNQTLGDGWSKTMTLQEAMLMLAEKTNYSSVELQKLIGRKEGVLAILMAASNGGKIAADDLEKVGDSANAMGEAFEEQGKAIGITIDVIVEGIKNKLIRAIENIATVVDEVGKKVKKSPLLEFLFDLGSYGVFEIGKGSVVDMEEMLKNDPNFKQRKIFENLGSELKEGRDEIEGMITSFKKTNQEVEKVTGEVKNIILQVENLKRANEEGNLSIKEYQDNLRQINALEQKLAGSREDVIAKTIKKLQVENEIKNLTVGLSEEILKSTLDTLQSLYSIANTDEQRLTLLKEIKRVNDQIEKTKLNFEVEDLDLEGYGKEVDKQISEELEKRQDAQKELEAIKFNAIDNEFERRRIAIDNEFKDQLHKINMLYDEKLISEKDYIEATSNLQKQKENELTKLSYQKWQTGLSAASSIADNLSRIVDSGNAFVEALVSALEIAEAIAATIEAISIIGSLFGGGGGAAKALKEGGEFYKGKVTPYKNIPKFSTGADFKVPSKFTNDSYLMRVGANERVKVTPAHKSGNTDKLLSIIADRISSVNANIASMETQIDIINNAPDIETTVRKNEATKNKLRRSGMKFNQEI